MAVRVSKTDFEEKVLKEKLTVLVDFYSDSCVACKKLAPVLGNAEDDYEDKIKIYKVNTNFDVELAEQYEVQANPTLILFKDGQAKDRKTGALKQAELNSWIEGLLYKESRHKGEKYVYHSSRREKRSKRRTDTSGTDRTGKCRDAGICNRFY